MLLHLPGIVVPDRHPALFEHGSEDLGSRAHRWAPMIEELVDDRVIWATEFTDEYRLFIHAKFWGGKKWKKALRKLDERLTPLQYP